MMRSPTLTIGQVAAAAGVTRKAVRVYEAKGLLAPADRTPTGYRLYDHHDVELLTFIRRARTLGLHLDDIRQILAIRNGGTPPCAAVRNMLEERINSIDATVADLLTLRKSLVGTRRQADDCCEGSTQAICRAIDGTQAAPAH
jgi:MerR family transcriptional regulator, copper efflux regulator